MTGLAAALADRPLATPSWLFRGPHREQVPPDDAARFLASLDPEDFSLLVLAYGLGTGVGTASQALALDPALVVWRLHRAFARWVEVHDQDPALLETAVAGLLRSGGERTQVPPPRGHRSWRARELVQELDDTVQRRLEERLARTTAPAPRAGVGIGTVILVLLAVVAFAGYGLIQDIHPLWRGQRLMREGRYQAARDAFQRVGTDEARRYVILCWLAEGEFDKALEGLGDPSVREWFGPFAPREGPLDPEDADPGSRALLPRGLMRTARPTFLVRAGPPAELSVTLGMDEPRRARLDLPDTRGGPKTFAVEYPESWPPLVPGVVVWTVADETGRTSEAAFRLLDGEERRALDRRLERLRTREIPWRTQNFLRGHFLINEGLYVQAAWQFARLRQRFPDEPYPLEMLTRVAGALGVDPQVFLR